MHSTLALTNYYLRLLRSSYVFLIESLNASTSVVLDLSVEAILLICSTKGAKSEASNIYTFSLEITD